MQLTSSFSIPKTPTGTQLSCKGWVQGAALRMLLNNQGTVLKNVIAPAGQNQVQVPLQGIISGVYTLILVHENKILDSITFSKL